jgi:flagellar basal-body rod protein FlgB
MDLRATTPDLFALVASKSRWLAQRHAVLSANVANADTPGFTPLDLKAFDARTAKRADPGIPLQRTASSHLAGGTASPADPGHVGRTKSWETAPSGNAVVLEEQAQKLAATQLDYQLAADVYGKYLAMMRTALGVGKA